MATPLRVGVTYPQNELGAEPGALHRFAQAAEQLGYDHLLMYDHVVGPVRAGRTPPLPFPGYDENDTFQDPLVAFGYLSAITTTIELVTGVLILPQRQTVLVARQAADVAILSGGRLRLGVGIGYNPIEYEALGEQWSTRGARFTEQIEYLRRLWNGGAFSFEGGFHHLDQAALVPVPADRIPIWCGGSSEVAYQRAARLADGFIFGYGMRDSATDSWQRVQQLLDEHGRDRSDFRALFNLLPDHPGSWMTQSVERVPYLRDAGATDIALTSARNELRGIDEHIDFIAQMKSKVDVALA